jgi:glycosyltransferase involved in cell wall biosynthesis/peptidoglycan/xylan/chitin deacetylase (PgdA/CDA1 family)
METANGLSVAPSLSGAGMKPSVKLSVVVPTRNRREVLIPRTLPAMFAQDMPTDEFEIIVVVDGATDGTAQALHELQTPCSLQIIEQQNRGPSAARNTGIRAAHGDLLLFIDDDIICSPQLFRQHVEAHADSEPAVVYGSLSIALDSPLSALKYANDSWYQKYYDHLNAQNGLKLPEDDYLISNSSMPRETLVNCGGFDETMTAKEDYELALRLWKIGLRFKYLPQATACEYFQKPVRYVLHNDGKTFGETDVLLSHKHPEYRPYSALAGLGKIRWWNRLRRRILAGLPVNPEGLLHLPLWICDKLCRFSIVRQVGRRLLGLGRGVVEFRSAARQIGSWRALQSEFGVRLPVLLYHHVGPQHPGTIRGLTVSAERFERQVRWLARRGYKGICPADWLRWRNEGKGLPDQPILFTFDDAYEDLAEYALPVLRSYGFGAAVYVVTGQLGGTNAWDEARGCGTLRLMTAEQIRFWASQGIEFGAHSRTHADLTSLSPQDLSDEVVGSGKDIEALLGSRVVSFAYPYGFHNQTVDNCVRSAFDLAFIADDRNEGMNHLQTDPHLLLRTMVQSDDSLVAMELRARWGHNPYLEMKNHINDLRARVALRTRLRRVAHSVMDRDKS